MKKTVISLSVFAAVGLSTQVFGQTQKTEGAVGVNTETPHATLEVETFDKDGTTNEGIMAPQLSKARVAKIKNPVEGTLVYVVDDASKGGTIDSYSGSDSKVSKITEKGYYYFNGEEWVKSAGNGNGTEGYWAQRVKDGVTETYLKPADDNGDFVGYLDKRFQFDLGNVKNNTVYLNKINDTSSSLKNKATLETLLSSDNLSNITDGDSSFRFFNNTSILKKQHVLANPNSNYTGLSSSVLTEDVSNISNMAGASFYAEYASNASLNGELVGGYFSTSAGNKDYRPANINYNFALVAKPNNFGNAKTITSIAAQVQNYGNADYIRGMRNWVPSQMSLDNVNFPAHSVKKISGIENTAILSKNGTLSGWSWGILNSFKLEEGTHLATNARIYAMDNSIDIEEDYSKNTFWVEQNRFNLKKSTAKANNVYLTQNTISSSELGAEINNFYGFYYWNANRDKWTAKKAYGIFLDEVINGTEENYGLYIKNVNNSSTAKNYAIYTHTGNVRLGDLAAKPGEAEIRNVVVNKDGVLQTEKAGAIQLTGTANMPCDESNRGKMNFQKDIDIIVDSSDPSNIQKKKGDAFGICLKGTDNEYYWRYLYGAGGVSNKTGAFGAGL